MTVKGYEQSLIGKKFGRLTVVNASLFASRNARVASCVCECGNVVNARVRLLVTGNTKSCGCLKVERNRRAFSKHNSCRTALYRIWRSMKERCLDKKCKAYKNYGGRGITICQEWMEFIPFKEWADMSGYTSGITIERIDNNLGYCPENCKWATRTEQGNNKRNNRIVTFNGDSKTLSQWAADTGISRETLKYRLNAGWSHDAIITTPVKPTFNHKKRNSDRCSGTTINKLSPEQNNGKQPNFHTNE